MHSRTDRSVSHLNLLTVPLLHPREYHVQQLLVSYNRRSWNEVDVILEASTSKHCTGDAIDVALHNMLIAPLAQHGYILQVDTAATGLVS